MPDGTQRRQPRERKLGSLEGRIWIANDFDETPQALIDAFEGNTAGDAHNEPGQG